MSYRIPFNRPYRCGNELRYLEEVLDSPHWAGDGSFTARCAKAIREAVGSPACLLTTSCTDALEMCGLLLDLAPGDEVIVPSFTFVSSVNAFVLRGARPVFADIRRDTLNIDESKLEALVTPRTKAIVVVHYAGVGCEMDEIMRIAQRHGISVVEDNAHGLFGKYRGRPLGSIGRLATQSFHETKNFTAGEGGALIVNDAAMLDRAEILREKGTNRSRFFRGQVDKYTWVDVGSSFLPSELNAAVLWAQLERRDWIQQRRREIWEGYREELGGWARERGVVLPFVPDHCEQAYHMFYMILPSLESRTRLIERLKSKGILAVFHYVPLHLSDMGRRFGGAPGDCPVTEDLSDRLLRLPFFNGLQPAEQDEVIAEIRAFGG
ncbi:MAG: dTDP-4-amino-4,6-dideoxygalactose transaminase [Betaproteobacteria bacterium]